MLIKELMLFKPDFYGKNVGCSPDRLIEIRSKENNNISGPRTYDAGCRGSKGNTLNLEILNGFLDHNRGLFTNIDNRNDWLPLMRPRIRSM